jgi:hypothetical protein
MLFGEFWSTYIELFIVDFPRKFNVMQHKIPKAQTVKYCREQKILVVNVISKFG